MKKTIPTSIAHTLLHIEEDAYAQLNDYLSSIRTYFSSYADSVDIIDDIETRIAEQCIEYSGKDRIVTKENVEKLIATMGKPEDFSDERSDNKEKTSYTIPKTSHKLYRDGDNALIGGVAAGIAAYFNIDPTIIRLIFVVVALLGGSSLLIYIILWIIIPEAKTTSQKLEMHGTPVTLESVRMVIKEKLQEVKDHSHNSTVPQQTKGFLKKALSVLGKIIGVALITASVIAVVVCTTMLLLAIVNPWTIPMFSALSVRWVLFCMLAIGLYLLVCIPAIGIGSIGLMLIRHKRPERTTSGILFVLWILSIIAVAVITFSTKDSFGIMRYRSGAPVHQIRVYQGGYMMQDNPDIRISPETMMIQNQ